MHAINYEKPPQLPHRSEYQLPERPGRATLRRRQRARAVAAQVEPRVWNDRWPESVEPLADTFAREPLLGAPG